MLHVVRYGFGWESQLLETGFLAIWLAPLTPRLLPRGLFTCGLFGACSRRRQRAQQKQQRGNGKGHGSGIGDGGVYAAALPLGCPPPFLCVFGYRWLLFRIMLGAGLIKIRGGACAVRRLFVVLLAVTLSCSPACARAWDCLACAAAVIPV